VISLTRYDYSESIFTFYKVVTLKFICDQVLHLIYKNLFQIISLVYHIKLYKNHIIESLFIQLNFFLTQETFSSRRCKKKNIMTSKNGHSSLQTPMC
jgi:hypothetical protein